MSVTLDLLVNNNCLIIQACTHIIKPLTPGRFTSNPHGTSHSKGVNINELSKKSPEVNENESEGPNTNSRSSCKIKSQKLFLRLLGCFNMNVSHPRVFRQQLCLCLELFQVRLDYYRVSQFRLRLKRLDQFNLRF